MKWLKRVVAVLLAAGVVVGISSSPALAFGPSGCGYTCDGKDPQYYNIDGVLVNGHYVYAHCAWDAYNAETTTATNSEGNLQIILRYSPNCQTAWAKPNELVGFNTNWSYLVWVESYNANWTFRTAYNSFGPCSPSNCANGGGGAWSLMVNDAGIYARACIALGRPDANNNWYTTTTCTYSY